MAELIVGQAMGGAAAGAATAEDGLSDRGYQNYALTLLLVIYIFNFVDRQVINILAEPIKLDLGLADWQLGLLTGLAFALCYTVLGLPIAWLAERRSRPLIISGAILVWSVCTALCGVAQSYLQLVLARIGVGVGEAGGTPPAHSLIVDYFPRHRRGFALGIYGMGAPLGMLVGLAFGGLIAEAYGWRAAFFIAGGPGLLLCMLAAFTLREPRHKGGATRAKEVDAAPTLTEVWHHFRGRRSYWLMLVAFSLASFFTYASGPFLGSFFLRNHSDNLAAWAGMVNATFGTSLGTLGVLGPTLGLVQGVGGALGMWGGGALSDRFAAKDVRRYLTAPAVLALVSFPVNAIAMLTPSLALSLLMIGFSGMLIGATYGPVNTALFSVSAPRMRATTSAMALLISSLTGAGLGPLTIGVISDLVAAESGSGEGIRWALVAAALVPVIAGVLYFLGARSVRDDIVS